MIPSRRSKDGKERRAERKISNRIAKAAGAVLLMEGMLTTACGGDEFKADGNGAGASQAGGTGGSITVTAGEAGAAGLQIGGESGSSLGGTGGRVDTGGTGGVAGETGTGGVAASETGGSGGIAETGGAAGETGGTGGSPAGGAGGAPTGGAGGTGGILTGGTGGSPTGGAAGSAGAAGAGGAAGTSGSAGIGGVGGVSGNAGTSGASGAAGVGGSAGISGAAGLGGAGGAPPAVCEGVFNQEITGELIYVGSPVTVGGYIIHNEGQTTVEEVIGVLYDIECASGGFVVRNDVFVEERTTGVSVDVLIDNKRIHIINHTCNESFASTSVTVGDL